jgi:preprotein translocase subunit SecY
MTFALLAVYRVGVHVPTPGINGEALKAFFDQAQGTLLGLFDMFAGGALSNLSVFALGIMPYISASIILQLLTVVIPYLDRLNKEGEAGRKKITQYTRYGTVVLSLIQGFGIAFGLEGMSGPGGEMVVLSPGWSFRLMTVITLTAGTAFIMWLGEQITERGIGNGISLIIFAGIVARMPNAIINTIRLSGTGELSTFIILILLVMMVVVVGIIMVIPPIFASSIIMFPATIANFIQIPWMKAIADAVAPGKLAYSLMYVGFIIFFCYFYTAVVFNPVDAADNMKKYGGFIPGIRPGKRTADYIDRVLSRITFGGALYVSAVCVLPTILIQKFQVPFYFGGTALLIVVGVAIDTVAQIESHMLTRHYEGFIKKSRVKGRR